MAVPRRIPAERGEFAHLSIPDGTQGLLGPIRRPQRIEWPDAGLAGIRWGASDPALILLHGGAVNAHSWDATMLSLGGNAWAIDLPGHGRSRWTEHGDFEPAALARTIAAAIGPGLSDVVLAGHSLGGLVALELAAVHPGLASAAVILDVTPEAADGAHGIREFVGRTESFPSRRAVAERARRFGLGGDDSALQVGVRLNTSRRPDGRYVFRHQLAHLRAGDPGIHWDHEGLWRGLAGLEIPVVLVRGDRGLVTLEAERRFLASGIRRHSITVPSGHNVLGRHPAVVAQVLADLTARRRRAPGVG